MKRTYEVNGLVYRICTKCSEKKPIEDYHKDKKESYGHKYKCKSCANNPVEFIPEGASKCSKCSKLLPIDKFHKRNDTRSSISSHCKECVRERYLENNTHRSRNKKRLVKEGIVRECGKCNELLPDTAVYFYKRRTWCKNCNKAYKNTETQKEVSRKYAIKRYHEVVKNDPEKVLVKNIRNQLSKSFKRVALGKMLNSKMTDLLSCTSLEFKEHLQNKFEEGMTWDNYGKYWHLDHKMPISKFDLSNQTQRRLCFHYKNIQPMRAKLNLEKSNKIIDQYIDEGLFSIKEILEFTTNQKLQ